MVVNYQNFVVNFGLGIDTKTDKNQVDGSLLELENSYVQKSKELKKRFGYSVLPRETLDGYQLTSGLSLNTFEDELILMADDRLYSYTSGPQKWADKGELLFAQTSNRPILTNAYEQTTPSFAVNNNTAIYSWEDSRGGVRAIVKDYQSAATILQDTELNGSAIRPMSLSVGNYLYTFYVEGTDLKATRVSSNSPAYETEVTIFSDMSATSKYYDICVLGTRFICAYINTSGFLRLTYINQDLTLGSPSTGTIDPLTVGTVSPDLPLTILEGETTLTAKTFHVIYGSSSAGMKIVGFYSNFDVYQPDTAIDATATDLRNIGAVYEDQQISVYYEIPAASVLNYYVNIAFIDTTDYTSTYSVLQRSAGLVSKPWLTSAGSSILVSFMTESALQDTYFVIDENGTIQAKIFYSSGAGHSSLDGCLPYPVDVDDIINLPLGKKTRIVVGGSSTQTNASFYEASLSYSAEVISKGVQLGKNLHQPGAITYSYDSDYVVEHNFHLYPEQPTIAQGSAGTIGAGTYLYKIVYEWIDSQGQIARSATSISKSFTLGSSSKQIDLTIPTLRYTAKKAPLRTEVTIGVYRTEASGSIFYKVSSDTSPLFNDTTADTVSFSDNIADASLTSRPLIYTTGGVLDNVPTPACQTLVSSKNRLFALGLENRNQVAVSKEFVENETVSFTAEVVINVDGKGGDIITGYPLGSNIIIFKESSLFYISGDGPDDTGKNNDFRVQSIPSDVGCSEPESIVETTAGLMFKSLKGIYLLTAGLTTQYIGDRVEDFNDYNISSAIVVSAQNQVRFTTTEGTSLVYNYFFNLWSTFTNQASISAVNYQNTYYFLKSTGEVWYETSEYADNGSPIQTTIGTQFFQLGQLQGYQRVSGVLILGKYKGPHKLRVKVYYDYQDFETDTYIKDLTDFATTYGSSSPYGASETFGDSDGVYQFEIAFSRQKCQAIRLVIDDIFPDSDPVNSFSLSGLTFRVGLKSTGAKMSRGRIITRS